jgi:hypothetical protein
MRKKSNENFLRASEYLATHPEASRADALRHAGIPVNAGSYQRLSALVKETANNTYSHLPTVTTNFGDDTIIAAMGSTRNVTSFFYGLR